VSLADFGSHNAAALRSNFESFERFRDLPQRIVSAIQAIEAARVILVVEPLRTEEVVKISQGAKNLDGPMIRIRDRRRGDRSHRPMTRGFGIGV
jgi:hypothetical protein